MDVRLDGEIRVTLSERNLKDLLKQTVEGDNPFLVADPATAQLVRSCEQPDGTFLFLRVVVEPDDVHYGERVPGPGVHGGF